MFRSKQSAPVNDHAKLRAKQIGEFLKLNPTAQHVSNGLGVADSTATYTLQLHTPSAGPLTLHVLLGPLFPERPPACQLTAQSSSMRLQHRYLDGNGFLSLHPKLQATHWSPHQNLGLVVQDLIRELAQQPPVLLGGAAPPFSAAAPSAAYRNGAPAAASAAPAYSYAGHHAHGNHSNVGGSFVQAAPLHHSPSPHAQHQPHGSPPIPPPKPALAHARGLSNGVDASASASASSASSSSPSLAPPARSRPPDVPGHFPELDAMSIGQLQDVLGEGDAAVRDLAAAMPLVSQMRDVQADLATRIGRMARLNLDKKDKFDVLRAQVNIEATRLREEQQRHALLLQRQQQSQSRYALPNLLRQLDVAISSAEEDSEGAKERFQTRAKDGPPAEEQALLDDFIKKRIAVHQRAAKKERLVEIYGRQ